MGRFLYNYRPSRYFSRNKVYILLISLNLLQQNVEYMGT